MELILGDDFKKELLAFCKKIGMENISFFPRISALKNTASGHIESNPLEGEFKVFPAFAAGVMCTTKDMHNYLTHLGESFKETNGAIIPRRGLATPRS